MLQLADLTQSAYGRALIGDSLGFHILFAAVGVGIPLLICIAEFIGIRWHSQDWINSAKAWTRVFVILFVAGAISGSLISIQLSAVWPKFMDIAGQAAGAAFFLEGMAFFVEAAFLGIYVLSWKRFKPWLHWLTILPVVIGGAASAFFITTANAFMNAPQGFTYKNGVVSNVHPWQAIFNPATLTETTHSIGAYYLMTAALVAAWYCWRLWHRPDNQHQRNILTGLVALMLVGGGIMGLTGDASAKYLARNEPVKLAAAEGLFKTQSHAPLQIGGIVSGHGIHYAITIPGLLSFLAYGSFNAVVKGLDTVSPTLWPPLAIHYFFDGMVAIGIWLVAIPGLFVLLWLARRRWAFSRPMLLAIGLSGALATIAVELGWLLTEIGRQPYVIRGILTTKDAITTSASVIHAAVIFPCLYVLLLGITCWILYRMRRPKLAKAKS